MKYIASNNISQSICDSPRLFMLLSICKLPLGLLHLCEFICQFMNSVYILSLIYFSPACNAKAYGRTDEDAHVLKYPTQ